MIHCDCLCDTTFFWSNIHVHVFTVCFHQARLWVQIMRQLRHGVRLKKVEQTHLPPSEYELTPFEILLEDIRLGRYKLTRPEVWSQRPTCHWEVVWWGGIYSWECPWSLFKETIYQIPLFQGVGGETFDNKNAITASSFVSFSVWFTCM